MGSSRIAILVIVFWFVGKLLAFGKDLLVSYYFGASVETDAYFIASNIPGLVYAGLLATVPLVLLPLYTNKISNANEVLANKFASSVLNWYASAALMLTAAVFIGAGFLVSVIAPTAPAATVDLAINLTRIFSATFVFSMISAVFTTIQLSNKQALGVQLIPIINNGFFVLGVFLFSAQYGIYAAAVSATVAWVLQIPLQALFVKAKYRYSFAWQLTPHDRKALFVVFLPALIGVSIEQLNPIVSIYFGSGLEEGSVSLLSYAFRIISFCTGIFIVITSTISYPEFAHKVSNKNLVELIEDIYWSTRLTLFAAVFAALVMSIFSRDVVAVILERGQLSSAHAQVAAQILSVLAISIPFVALREIYIRGIYAFSEARLGMLTGFIALVANIVFSYVLISRMGIQAIAIATLASAVASSTVGFILLHRIFRSWPTLRMLVFSVKLLLATSVTVLASLYAVSYLSDYSAIFRLILGSVIAGVVYLIGAILVGIIRFDLSDFSLVGELRKR